MPSAWVAGRLDRRRDQARGRPAVSASDFAECPHCCPLGLPGCPSHHPYPGSLPASRLPKAERLAPSFPHGGLPIKLCFVSICVHPASLSTELPSPPLLRAFSPPRLVFPLILPTAFSHPRASCLWSPAVWGQCQGGEGSPPFPLPTPRAGGGREDSMAERGIWKERQRRPSEAPSGAQVLGAKS